MYRQIRTAIIKPRVIHSDGLSWAGYCVWIPFQCHGVHDQQDLRLCLMTLSFLRSRSTSNFLQTFFGIPKHHSAIISYISTWYSTDLSSGQAMSRSAASVKIKYCPKLLSGSAVTRHMRSGYGWIRRCVLDLSRPQCQLPRWTGRISQYVACHTRVN